MKKFTRVLGAVMAVLMCVALLASCNNGNKDDKSYTAKNTEFIIGATGPLTGDAAVYGVSVKNGALLAVEEINKNGGLDGVNFKFDMLDDQATEEPARSGFNTLLEGGMQLSLGSVTSGSAAAFVAAAKEEKVVSLTPSASAENVIATSDYSFRVCFSDPQQGEFSANELTKTYTKIGAIYDESDTYSSGIYEAFKAQMIKLGKAENTDFVAYTFNQDSNTNFATQVQGLKDAGCDVIYLPIYYTEASLILKAAKAIDFNVPVFGNDGLDGIKGMVTADDGITASVKYLTPFDVTSTDAKVKGFVDAYKAKYNEEPTQFAADGYDAVMILFEAMKKAGVTKNDVTASAADLSAKVKTALTSSEFKYSGLTGNDMTWDASGSCNKAANIVDIIFG